MSAHPLRAVLRLRSVAPTWLPSPAPPSPWRWSSGFYAATQATSPFALHSWGIEFWVAAALPAGAGAAVAGWAGASRLARSRPLRLVLGLLLVGGVLAAWPVGPSLYRTAEALVAGQITALVVAALLDVEFAWLRSQHPAYR
jgi:hypothetical protein